MKKTLLLLALLLPCPLYASLTKIETIESHTTSNGIDTWTLSNSSTESLQTGYVYVALLDVNSLETALNATPNPLNGKKLFSANNQYHFGIALKASPNAGDIAFSNVETGTEIGANFHSLSSNVNVNSSLLSNENGSALVAATLSFSVGWSQTGNNTSGIAGLSLRYADGSSVNSYANKSDYKASRWSCSALTTIGGLTDSITVYSGNRSDITENNMAAAAQSVISASVPEPATATLSLLALAGLAMRRRRK